MGRILAIDYGLRRTGIAVSDPLQIIANSLETVETKNLLTYLKTYVEKENVAMIVIGLPKNLANEDTDATSSVRDFIKILQTTFPTLPIHSYDERFTSKMAMQTLVAAGTTKKFRKNKTGNIDKVSATIILQDFMSFMQK
jgi:putative holliday junction resolvase